MTEPIGEPTVEPDETGTITVEIAADDDSAIDDSEFDPRAREALQKARREAASLRKRYHELEAEHEGAVTRLAAMEHAEVERHAAEYLIDPTDVWRQQPDLTAYYDAEFKQVVGDKVREAAEAIIAAKPHLARPSSARPPTDRPLEGLRGGAAPEVKQQPISWSSALRGR